MWRAITARRFYLRQSSFAATGIYISRLNAAGSIGKRLFPERNSFVARAGVSGEAVDVSFFGTGRRWSAAQTIGLLLLLACLALAGRGYLAYFTDRVERIFYGVKPGVTLAGYSLCGCLKNEVWVYVAAAAVERQRQPQNASVDRASGEIIPEQDGLRVDVALTVELVMAAPKGEAVDFATHVVKAEYDRTVIAAITEKIGSFLTYIPGSEARAHNIRLAAAAINNTLVYPGQIFSFNKTVGPRTPERGYKPAPVIVGGGMSLDAGGGICQVSSTLYNAALRAGMEIIERHPHSIRIHYVPVGKDAAVAYNYLDLQFRNNGPTPVLIKGSVYGRQIVMSLLGRKGSAE